ncbi:MAG: protein kinase, partial [Chloroflexota bacterium]
VGTLAYMAPEQIAGTSEIDARTDVYALGVVCFELLSGQSPFTGKVANLLFAHLHQPVPDLCDLRADVPEHIRDAVSKALEKDPDDRFETVEAFARAIRGI